MINTIHRMKHRRDDGGINGFTMIEILIVIVVLGILSAVVIFALGGITGKTAQASCAADGSTVSTAMADFKTQNVNIAVSMTGLINGTVANGNSRIFSRGRITRLTTLSSFRRQPVRRRMQLRLIS